MLRALLLSAGLLLAVLTASVSALDVTYPPYPSQVTRDATGRIVDVSWRLAFRPPALVNPVNVYVSNTNRRPSIPANQDAIIHWPSTPVNPSDGGDVQILGGHNVVSVGGAICPGSIRRGLLLKGFTGTMFIEGLRVGGNGCPLNEGIDVDTQGARGTKLVLENVTVGGPNSPVQGSYQTNHADLMQVWNGPASLSIDRFDGWSAYQGFMLQPAQFGGWQPTDFGTYDVRRTAIHNKLPDGTSAYAVYDAGGGFATSSEDLYADSQAGREDYLGRFGSVLAGPPLHGDFAGQPGVGYVSPGYN